MRTRNDIEIILKTEKRFDSREFLKFNTYADVNSY